MKTRVVKVKNGYVPQVKYPYHNFWYGVTPNLTLNKSPDLQLSWCVFETEDQALNKIVQFIERNEDLIKLEMD